MKTVIVIPARFGSTRFPGKPLHPIAGKTLLQRVCETATQAASQADNLSVLVATDDERILQHAQSLQVPVVMTPEACETGSDRVMAAIEQLAEQPDYVINLQGDTPLLPINVLVDVIKTLQNNPSSPVVTPAVQLSWDELDRFRAHKQKSPFSGTTVVMDTDNRALWFSKNIIPAIRNEGKLRAASDLSPVFRHIGLYAYQVNTLRQFVQLSPSYYEHLEGLEQLRLLENGIAIHVVPVKLNNFAVFSGVDTPEDAKLAEQLLTTL